MMMSRIMVIHVGKMGYVNTSKGDNDDAFETEATFIPTLTAATMVISQPSQEQGVHPHP
jgi:hypothetical protein